jgi:hypothetical protein
VHVNWSRAIWTAMGWVEIACRGDEGRSLQSFSAHLGMCFYDCWVVASNSSAPEHAADSTMASSRGWNLLAGARTAQWCGWLSQTQVTMIDSNETIDRRARIDVKEALARAHVPRAADAITSRVDPLLAISGRSGRPEGLSAHRSAMNSCSLINDVTFRGQALKPWAKRKRKQRLWASAGIRQHQG